MRNIKWLVLMAVVLVIVSCGKKRLSPRVQVESDSLIAVAEGAHDPQRMLVLIDSLEKVGDVSPVEAAYRRAVVCYDQEQFRQEEAYYRTVVAADIKTESDQRYYFNSVTNLTARLLSKGDYEGALRTTLSALKKMEDSHVTSPHIYAGLYNSVGNCHLNLEQQAEAAANYAKAYAYYQQDVAADTTSSALRSAIVGICNTAIYYINAKYYAESLPWLDRIEQMLAAYNQKSRHDEVFAGEIGACLDLYRATAYQGLGRTGDAAAAYREFESTDYAQSDLGRLDATDYLVEARRYREAADKLQHLDRLMGEWGMDYSLENIQGYLLPKFRANLGAGRQDSALAVGAQICQVLDSAIRWQKRSDAAELATIYDTQEKERTIAAQEASLGQQRLIAISAVSVLVVLALALFIHFRQRAARQLAAEHAKLLEAYAEVERSNAQLERKNGELTVANARAEESSKMKTNFIKQISHEIRTPLNILSGFTQVLTTPGMTLDEAMRSDINRQVKENTDRITGLVNKMLELSDASSSAVIDRSDLVTAQLIALQAVDDSGVEHQRHVSFTMVAGDDVAACPVHTNQRVATRVLALLLDNACKFTRPAEAFHGQGADADTQASVVLRLTDDGRRLLFAVEDTGKGVPPEEAEHIFDEFVQLDEYYDGTGIGLTVARSLARRLGGDVWLDTSYTAGARFVMALPVEK